MSECFKRIFSLQLKGVNLTLIVWHVSQFGFDCYLELHHEEKKIGKILKKKNIYTD